MTPLFPLRAEKGSALSTSVPNSTRVKVELVTTSATPTPQFQEDWYDRRAIDYVEAWELQREILAQRADGKIGDTVLLLEHPAVYTAGKRTLPFERPMDGTPVIDVDRGGKITFHGPGQLVGYPITKLPSHVLVVDYVRRVEEALIRAVAELGVAAGRVPGRSGVWLAAGNGRPERKVAAIGIRVSRGVTMHGFALNCNVDLDSFANFIPCGITDAGVASLSIELDRDVTVQEAAAVVKPQLTDLLAWNPYTPTPNLIHDPVEDAAIAVL